MAITNKIHFRNIKGDIFGGLTAAVIALPMALTFGITAFGDIPGGASAGLWSAILIGFFAALFGGTPTLISEPTGPMTVVMTSVIASLTAANPENGLAMAFTVVMLAGVFQILFGYFKLGKYVTLMPYTVISGFMSGIGVILIVLQIAPFLGQKSPKGGVLGTLGNIPELLGGIQPVETFLAVITVAILLFYPSKLKKFFPPQLLALVVGTLIAVFFLGGSEIRTIGTIQVELPTLQLPYFAPAQIREMIVDGLVLGMLGLGFRDQGLGFRV